MAEMSFDELIAAIEGLPGHIGHGRGIKDAAERNPWGIGNMPPPNPQFDGTGDLRSGNTPIGDAVGQAIGPEAGAYASKFDRGMGAAAGVAEELTMIPQAKRAGTAVSEAIGDPSIENLTNAGLQSAMTFPTARGFKAAIGSLGVGYGAAIAKDSGASPIGALTPSSANADTFDDAVNKVREQAAAIRSRHAADAAAAEKSWDKSGLGPKAKMEARSALSQKQEAELKPFNDQIGELGRQQAAKFGSEEQARIAKEQAMTKAAQDASAKEWARDRRASDTTFGKVLDKTGGVAGAALAAGGLARLSAKGGSGMMREWGTPMIAGGTAGEIAAHYPSYYNANFTEAMNPALMAAEAYAREAPEGPDRNRALAEAERLRKVQPTNPIHDAGQAEFYDPWKFGERTVSGLWQGAGAGKIGALAAGVPAAVGRGAVSAIEATSALKGKSRASAANAGAEAANAEGVEALAKGRTAAAEADASKARMGATRAAHDEQELSRRLAAQEAARAEAEKVAAEAARRSSAGTGATGPASAGSSGQSTGQGLLPPPESVSSQSQALSFSPETYAQLNALLGPLQQGLRGLPSQDQVNQLMTRIGQPARMADDQFNALMGAMRPPAPPVPPPRNPPQGRNPADDMRYFDAASGANGQSQADIVRNFLTDSIANGQKFGRRSGDITQAEIGRRLDAAGSADPIGKSQITNRYQALNAASKAHLGKDLSGLSESEFNKLMGVITSSEAKAGKGGKTLALPLAVGGGAGAMYGADDASADERHHSYTQPRRSDGTFKGPPR